MLAKRGFGVHTAGNGREALSIAAAGEYDLVFMDCQMPEMDGYQATGAIRAVEADGDAHLPVVAMTAHALKGDRERCLAAGMDDYLSKPLRPTDLDAVLERWLGAAPAGAAPAATANAEPVRGAAHKLTGSCQNIGAARLAGLAAAIEQGESAPDADELEQ